MWLCQKLLLHQWLPHACGRRRRRPSVCLRKQRGGKLNRETSGKDTTGRTELRDRARDKQTGAPRACPNMWDADAAERREKPWSADWRTRGWDGVGKSRLSLMDTYQWHCTDALGWFGGSRARGCLRSRVDSIEDGWLACIVFPSACESFSSAMSCRGVVVCMWIGP